MAKAPPKTPAGAAEKDEKAAELPPAPAAEAEPQCPYLLSFAAFNRIFDSHSASTASSSESIDSIDTTAPAVAATLKTTAEKFRLLQEALGVQHFDVNPRTAAWVDFCFGVICFARQEGESDRGANRSHTLTDEKALLLLTIANDIFQFATTTAAATATSDKNCSGEELHSVGLPSVELCYNRFCECVRQVSSVSATNESDTNQQPPAATSAHAHKPTLSTHEVARFVVFMTATFFRHLPAYQFVFRHARPSVTREMELFVEMPVPPLPLAVATLIEADIE